ncbi:uncharacterized protein N7529_001790 [Penicillium soppii]|uniref:uncharacterized protein n=1 Tax=Penicillium soppii TaxID=69789 RepID=UPI002548A01C|nr:uncharacterized protein N7529_001790 [Penicillium soppii]KAJ5876206.1 hypothetical protein N7529_001790 [Penicillium soppii]
MAQFVSHIKVLHALVNLEYLLQGVSCSVQLSQIDVNLGYREYQTPEYFQLLALRVPQPFHVI